MRALPSLFVGLAAVSAGCTSWHKVQTTGPAAPHVSLDGDARLSDVFSTHTGVWTAEYESQQRRPVQTRRVGEGIRRTFITGSLHGDDADSVRLLDTVAARLTDEPGETIVSRYLLLRTPNPDGLAAEQPWNANGVDLNRNFPSPRFVPGDNRSGRFPASEPETRIVLRLLADFQPDCVIQIRTANVSAVRVFANASGASALGTKLDQLPVERGRFDEISLSGSLEEFASQRLRTETVTIVVPKSTAQHPSTVDALLALCTGDTSIQSGVDQSAAVVSPRPGSGTAELTGTLEPIEQDGAHGFVELLPPPPESGSGVDRPGFYELPPPS